MWWDQENDIQWEKYSDAVERLGPQWGTTTYSEFRNKPVNLWTQRATILGIPARRDPLAMWEVQEMSDAEYLAKSPYGRFLREQRLKAHTDDQGTRQRYVTPGYEPEKIEAWHQAQREKAEQAARKKSDYNQLAMDAWKALLEQWLQNEETVPQRQNRLASFPMWTPYGEL